MKKIIIGLIALAALAGGIFLLSGKGEETSKNAKARIGDKIYMAVEETGEIAVVSAKDRTIIKRIDLSSEIGGSPRFGEAGRKIGFRPHSVQAAPDNKSVWVTANAIDVSKNKTSLLKIPQARADEGHGEEGGMKISDQVIVIDPLMDKIIKRIEMGADLSLSHIALTSDSNYAMATSQAKGIIYKINAKTYEVEVEKQISAEKGYLTAEETAFDFGSIPMYGGKVKHNFTLKNTGQAPVKISKIYTSCMCTEVMLIADKTKKGPFGMPGHGGLTTFANQEIGAGEEAIVEVEVDPAAHGPQGTGPAKKVVYIETDDSQKLQLMMDINVIK